jgi:hypothetical protein
MGYADLQLTSSFLMAKFNPIFQLRANEDCVRRAPPRLMLQPIALSSAVTNISKGRRIFKQATKL